MFAQASLILLHHMSTLATQPRPLLNQAPPAAPTPPQASLILLHHMFTLALLAIPLKYPRLAIYTCWVSLWCCDLLGLVLDGASRPCAAGWPSEVPMPSHPHLLGEPRA